MGNILCGRKVGLLKNTKSVTDYFCRMKDREELDDDEPYLEFISKEAFIESVEEASNQDEEE